MNSFRSITCYITLLCEQRNKTPFKGGSLLRSVLALKKWGIGFSLVTLLLTTNPVNAYSDDEDPVMTREQRFYFALEQSVWAKHYHHHVFDIAMCESSLRANAVGDHGESIGLLQINTRWHPKLSLNFNLYDPVENLNAGYIVFLERHRTFNAWSCAK